MKYKDMNLNDSQLREMSLLKSNNLMPCGECGEPTYYVEYCSEARRCSEECEAKFNNYMNAWIDNCDKHEADEMLRRNNGIAPSYYLEGDELLDWYEGYEYCGDVR